MRYTDVLPFLGAGARTHAVRQAVQQWFQPAPHEPSELARDLDLERERARCERRDAERLIDEVGDDLLQDLGAIAYFVAAARHEAKREGSPLSAPLERIGGLLAGTMRHCRSAVEEQALFLTQRRGLLPALEHLVQVLNLSEGPRVDLIAEPARLGEVTRADGHELFRIAEAVLLDARKRGAAAPVVIRVRVEEDDLSLGIESARDSVAATGGLLALETMELASYRVRCLGGRIDFGVGGAAGLRVVCHAPLRGPRPVDRPAPATVPRIATLAAINRSAAVVADGPYCPT